MLFRSHRQGADQSHDVIGSRSEDQPDDMIVLQPEEHDQRDNAFFNMPDNVNIFTCHDPENMI